MKKRNKERITKETIIGKIIYLISGANICLFAISFLITAMGFESSPSGDIQWTVVVPGSICMIITGIIIFICLNVSENFNFEEDDDDLDF